MIKNYNSENNDKKKLDAWMKLPLKRWRTICVIKEDNIENNDKKKNLNAYMKFPLMRRRMTCVIKKENSENIDKEKELECLYDTSPGEKEDDVCDLKNLQ